MNQSLENPQRSGHPAIDPSPSGRPARVARDVHRDDGLAIVEFAIIGNFLVLLLVGIISFGLLLSFQQNLTQAAAEGARSVVGYVDDIATPTVDERDQKIASTLSSVTSQYSEGCENNGVEFDGVTCSWKIHSCADDTSNFALIVDNRIGRNRCVTVRIEYDNRGDNRLLPAIPLISSVEPDRLVAQSTARLEREVP